MSRSGSRSAGREDVADRLHSAAVHLLRRLKREDRAAAITPARLSALSVLVYGGRRTLGELAAGEQVTAPTMSRLVKGLVDDGLVRRLDDPDDKRVIHLEATARGRRALERARRRRIELFADLLSDLDAASIRALGEAADLIEDVVRPSQDDD